MSTLPPAIRTVVLVDDDSALRLALTFMLELDGFAVTALESGEALLQAALPPPPVCLVLDQNLTGLTGLEALAVLRARMEHLPAVLITSHPRTSTRETAAALGAVIVEKPLMGESLSAAINAALS
ncbi:MAG: response regulator [Phenylobacterium sp.]|uniref:response regulator n=1 Tax=Phenylobacterium sp. TaxID=1871053 RepID=UPI00271AC712|nr:response regulator [Phenylobacterium sp.]MDO8913000.1 response regulator [Phenylobacterium sp.]MDP2012247.1 response regulator [Phenylobacterium sp.]MDP3099319.1 response regulator [Phenylobacterium sp.]MDP3632776.1 response regulator [Phenylobacterium sp.]MDP3866824.1 response regulator [Phenylobacterium sp.]